MNNSQERILIVEDDPDISDLIARQVLRPLGYRVKLVQEAPLAIRAVIAFEPDVMIVNLHLSGLSGKDLMVALSAQGLETPVIVIAGAGMEGDVIQAFRVGASDYIGWPVREAEVVSAVERALKQVRARRERERLAQKVNEANQKLQSRIRELTTIMGIGKAVTSTRDRNLLFNKIVEGAVFVSEADKGWLLLQKTDQKTFYLSAQKNLPYAIAARKDQPWDDGISSLVALSGESLSIHGAPLKRFKVAQLGNSVLVVPVKIQKEVVGLLVVVCEAPIPFSQSNKTLLEALADYASISLVNVRLFQAVEERAHSLQSLAETSQALQRKQSEITNRIHQTLETILVEISKQVGIVADSSAQPLDETQQDAIKIIRGQLQKAVQVLESFSMVYKANAPLNQVTVSLTDLARQAIIRHNQCAQDLKVVVRPDYPSRPTFVVTDVEKINLVFDVLLAGAICASSHSDQGEVMLKIQRMKHGNYQVSIRDSSTGLSLQDQEKIFDLSPTGNADRDVFGIGLALSKEIIRAHGGDVWVESHTGQGSTYNFTLQPMLNN